MMPPDCCLCEKGRETGDDCELICFERTESDQEWHVRAASDQGFVGHPPECEWFCHGHVATARSLVQQNLALALAHLRKHERWMLIYIDLFDRDTPPLVQKSGVGFESGFLEFWDQMLATIEVNGTRYPSDFRLSFAGELPDYSLERGGCELMAVKTFLSGRNDALAIEQQIAKAQASEMRTQGHPGVVRYLTTLCGQFTEQAAPALLKNRNA